MIKRIPLLAIFLSGCVLLSENRGLYGEFDEYKKSVAESSIVENYSRFFDVRLTSSISIDDPSSIAQLEFSKYMEKEIIHYDVIENGKGCLTVNGVDQKGSPIAFYVEYKMTNKAWLISDVDVSILENEKEYRNEPLCPGQVRVN